MSLESKVCKQFEIAVRKYRKDGSTWSVKIMKRMIEDSNHYDSDVITYIKNYLKELDKKQKNK
jgi:hypothetical protein